MAAVTLLGSATFNTTAGSKTVTATPAASDLIVIITAHSGNTSTSATPPTDNNSDGLGTYAFVTSALKNGSADVMCVWVRKNKIGSATSTVFTHAPGTTTGGGLAVLKVTGMTIAGLLAAIRSGASANQASGGTPSVSLGAAANTNNPVIGAVFSATNSTTTVANNASYTERFDNGYATPTSGLEVMTRDSGETGSSVSWGGTVASAFCAVLIELDVTVPAASSTLTDNYDDNSRDTAKWTEDQFAGGTTTGVTVTEQNGRLEVLGPASNAAGVRYSGYVSAILYTLDSIYETLGHASMQTSEVVYFNAGPDNVNYYGALIDSGTLYFVKRVAGVQTILTTVGAWSATTHKRLRLRWGGAGDNNVYLDTATSTSSDPPVSGDWTNRASAARDTALNLDACRLAKGGGSYITGPASPTTFIFDGFNTATTGGSVLALSGAAASSLTGAGVIGQAPSMSGVGALTPTGRSIAQASLSASGAGGFPGVGAGISFSSGAFSGAGVGATSQVGATLGTGALSAATVGSISFVGLAQASASLSVSGLGSNSQVGSTIGTGSLTGAGIGSLNAVGSTGTLTASGALAASGAGAVASEGRSIVAAAFSASGAGNLAEDGQSLSAAALGASGVGSTIVTGRSAIAATFAGSGSAALNEAGRSTVSGALNASGVASADLANSTFTIVSASFSSSSIASMAEAGACISPSTLAASSSGAMSNSGGSVSQGALSSSANCDMINVGGAFATGALVSSGFGVVALDPASVRHGAFGASSAGSFYGISFLPDIPDNRTTIAPARVANSNSQPNLRTTYAPKRAA